MNEEVLEYESNLFDEAISFIKSLFGIVSLYDDQIKLIKAFCSGRNIYFSAGTGYGKSLVFQSIPYIFDCINEQAYGTSTLLVVCPLISLMEDQVASLKKAGINAVALHSENSNAKMIDDIEEGIYSLVYMSPESMLSKSTFRQILSSNSFRKHCIGVVIDEAHLISQWGYGQDGKKAFRKWFANLMEFRNLIDDCIKFAVFTATATVKTEEKIFESLGLNEYDFFKIVKNPDRVNIRYSTSYIKDVNLSKIFNVVVEEIRTKNIGAPKRLIYCQTRKQCALIYNHFHRMLGTYMYKNCEQSVELRLVEMFHGGTPNSVKSHILNQITASSSESHLRVVICTIAFGMGINCVDVSECYHFGPSKTLEAYLQESGRIGRNGTPSISRIIYNNLLLRGCSPKVKEFVNLQSCRRVYINSAFSVKETTVEGCYCCDNCAEKCICSPNCALWSILPELDSVRECVEKKRTVSSSQKNELKVKLNDYRKSLLQFNANTSLKTVSFPNIYLEFDTTQVNQVLEHCERVFCFQDIMTFVEIWRKVHAKRILEFFLQIFDDMDVDDKVANIDSDISQNDSTLLGSDFVAIRDDNSSLFELTGDSDIREIGDLVSFYDKDDTFN